MSSLIGKDKRTSLEKAVGLYLSDQHRHGVAEGCAFAALGPDVARHGPEARRVMQQGIEDQIALLELLVETEGKGSSREEAIASMATMVGALVLARAVEDTSVSSEILEAAAHSILQK
jgi:TetR/AcrR family transcriptional regulator, transcriptional repressor for nem operon